MDYQLRVIRHTGSPEKLNLVASSEDEARSHAEKQGYIVLSIDSHTPLFQFNKETFPLALFCQELQTLLEAGLQLPEALNALIEKETRIYAKDAITKLFDAVKQGRSLSDGMLNRPDAFPALFVAVIRTSETTGNLPEALMRYSLYLEQVDKLKKRIISASIYPSVVLGFGLLVIVFLLGFVVPRFSQIYGAHVTHLSFTTQILLTIGQFFQQYGFFLFLILIGAVASTISLLSRQEIRTSIAHKVLHLPLIGEKIRIYYLSQLYRTFAMLLKSGIPIVSGLTMVSDILTPTLQTQLNQAKRLISEGQSFTEVFLKCNLTTTVAYRLFKVGEKTGNLEEMMEKVAFFHEQDMLRSVDTFLKLFEPILIAVIGFFIGGIVVMLYLPIFELASGLQ